MPTDDILWQKVDNLIDREAEETQASGSASQQPSENATGLPQARRRLAPRHANGQASRVSSTDARAHDVENVSTQASMVACYRPEWVEVARRVVKPIGKEIAFTRLTSAEKGRLTEAVYRLRRQGARTSENEVLRIAISYLLEDFGAYGKHSFLQKVIDALLA